MATKTNKKKKLMPVKGHKPTSVEQFAKQVNDKYGEALERLSK